MALVSTHILACYSPRLPAGGIAGLLAGGAILILAAMEPDMAKPRACASFRDLPFSGSSLKTFR